MSILLNQNLIRLCSTDYDGSVSDGPGVRTVIYVQGCKFGCKNCHNKQTWDFYGGYTIEILELFDEIVKKSKYQRITISGGEPLLQKEAVYELIKLLHSKHYDIALYTGYELKDVPQEFFGKLHYIKTGRFIQELSSTVIPYVGSSNQKFVEIRGTGEFYEFK